MSNSNIPVYSIVCGILTLLVIIFTCCMTFAANESFCSNVSLGFTILFIVAHFGVQCWGSYLVFGNWQHWRYDEFYCDRSTYLLSFSTLIIYWVLGLCLCKAGSGWKFHLFLNAELKNYFAKRKYLFAKLELIE